MPNARICRKCGADLVPDVWSSQPGPEHGPPASGEEMVLSLVVSSSGYRFCLQEPGEYTLGRSDADSRTYVDIDLSAHGGWEAGVSRRHARIFKQRGKYFLEDLRSSNGTFLNEERLEPGASYALQDGDTIKLGVLRLTVELA